MKKIIRYTCFVTLLMSTHIFAQTIAGQHKLSLQWISWDYFGKIATLDQNGDGSYPIRGMQQSRDNGDYLLVDGVVSQFEPRKLFFQGKIVTRVSHINGGRPCVRQGDFSFTASAGRRYWRLDQFKNPCDQVTDYVDIFF